ncbi:malonic semialdehyde reductase [Paeniglutamicibacter cryotolerans]|uniref:Nitroreductase n=1 Tax=Paeniglutamicibacter cryotolerans TaxID=670079 RepID=A0A839QL15_9MICC|nr:malonic semialdehyde reductase [Paeniglutamicibacter cryotolerans]MBB2996899.1 nitroreductase [Paeniglutamicibacter cryotolerans]
MSTEAQLNVDVDAESILDPTTLDTLFREARTANTFSDEPVDDSTLEAIYELTKMGPTMMNNQPLRITWVRTAEARERLAAHMLEGNRAKTITAPMVALLSADANWHEHFETFFPHAPERKAQFDAIEGLRTQMALNNAHLQAGYMIMAIRAMGLHAGPMGGFDAAGIDAEFNAGTANKSFLIMNIGKPGTNPWFDRLPRLDFDVATSSI